jgi:hypothetical protein
MTLVIYASFLVLVTYVLLTACLTGLPPSLSNTYYQLEAIKKNTGAFFTLLCWAVGFSVVAAMLEISEGKWFQFIAFFAGAALCLVGAAPRFKAEEHRIHCLAAAVAAGAAVIWIILIGLWWIPLLWFSVYGIIIYKDRGRATFWGEMAGFTSAYHALYLLY